MKGSSHPGAPPRSAKHCLIFRCRHEADGWHMWCSCSGDTGWAAQRQGASAQLLFDKRGMLALASGGRLTRAQHESQRRATSVAAAGCIEHKARLGKRHQLAGGHHKVSTFLPRYTPAGCASMPCPTVRRRRTPCCMSTDHDHGVRCRAARCWKAPLSCALCSAKRSALRAAPGSARPLSPPAVSVRIRSLRVARIRSPRYLDGHLSLWSQPCYDSPAAEFACSLPRCLRWIMLLTLRMCERELLACRDFRR